MKRYCFFAIIFTLLGIAYTTAHNKSAGIPSAVYDIVYSDTTSTSQADSLALAQAEMFAMMMMADSLNTTAPDTTLAVADSISVVKADSVAIDSASLKPAIPDSLIVGYMPERTSWKYFPVKQRSADDIIKLKNLYKKIMAEHNGALNAYDAWKIAFNSTQDRTLDMYIDGATMILSRYCADTLNKRYDRLSEHRDELMELYDLAIYNLDALNAQLDTAKNKDTLSVAKFRGRQLRYYRDITLMDSIFNGDSLNRFISRDTLTNRINNDIIHLRFMYPRYKEIVASTDMNVDMVDIAMFAILSDIRIVRDREVGLDRDTRKVNFEEDCALVRGRVEKLLAYIEDPTSIIYKDDYYSMSGRDTVTVGRWFNSQRRPIDEALRYGEGRFIDISNFEALETYWAEKFQKEGDYDEVINSPLANHKKSETYIQALRLKYDVEPSFDLAKQISERSLLKAEQRNLKDVNFKDAISYLERSFKFPEFSKQSSFAQAQMYVSMMKLQLVAKRTQSAKNYLSKAKKACSAYPDVYYYEASLLSERNFGNSEFVTGIKFCAVYDLYALCLKKFKELKANPGSEIKTSLEEEDIKTQMQWCEQNFMSQGEAFANGIYESGKRQTKIGEYNTVIRFAK